MGKNYSKRYYVVWKGRHPGVYDDFNDAMEQVDDYPGALFKSYGSAAEATEAFRRGVSPYATSTGGESGERRERGEGGERGVDSVRKETRDLGHLMQNASRMNMPASGKPDYFQFPEIDLNGWAVDAACSGNPGKMEYRGVELMTGRELFKVGPFTKSTNNIGEFLAIVHALAMMEKLGESHPIYSDSRTGIAWVRNKKVKTQLTRNKETEPSFKMMERALAWLTTHTFRVPVRKWETERWGEIPADFGRK
ncbi:MAG: ribonuclease H family protein [Muribaculaceae bacterium]|nr:ribonuclease H family protein [Muribaculaceae bacterium]